MCREVAAFALDWAPPPSPRFLAPASKSPKSFPCHTYEKCGCKSFRCHTYKNKGLKVLCLPHLRKKPGVPLAFFVPPPASFILAPSVSGVSRHETSQTC